MPLKRQVILASMKIVRQNFYVMRKGFRKILRQWMTSVTIS